MSRHERFPCPCCSRPVIRPTATQIIVALSLPHSQAAIVSEILRKPGEPVSTDVLVRAIYQGSDARLDAARMYATLKESMARLKKPLLAIGLRVESCGYGAGWRAVWL